MTPVVYLDSGRRHNFGRTTRLRLRITTLVDERAAYLTTLVVKDFTWLG
jgi:hypothetical protein